MRLPIAGRSASQEHYRSSKRLSRAARPCGAQPGKKKALAGGGACGFGSVQHRNPWRLVLSAPAKADPQSSSDSGRKDRIARGDRQYPVAVTHAGARAGTRGEAEGRPPGVCPCASAEREPKKKHKKRPPVSPCHNPDP